MMNRTSYGQSEWEFNKNYKIPKRKFNDDNNPVENSTVGHKTPDDAYEPLEPNDIRGYSPGETSRPLYQQNKFETYQQQQSNLPLPKSDYDDLPQFDCDAFQSCSTQHFQPFLSKQNSFHVNQHPGYYKRPREVPKNNGNGAKYADTFPHRSDLTLPRELTELFQPLYCKLCHAQLSSNSMAKLHYKSKNHEKKLRKFLVDYSERTGERLHYRAMIGGNKKLKLEEDNDPKYFHCDVCDLPLTGRLHAESHYMGKNHQKAIAGKAPAGKGHFNDEGKWVRNTTPAAVSSARDGIGLDFVASPTEFSATEDLKPKNLHCELCDVKVTSEQQMALHLSGQKHKKRLQQQINDTVDEDAQGDPENNILSTLSSNMVTSGDLSVYRTPTGYYYCNPCNLTLNSEIQFKQHLGSKKHRKKASGSKE